MTGDTDGDIAPSQTARVQATARGVGYICLDDKGGCLMWYTIKIMVASYFGGSHWFYLDTM